MPQPVMLKKLKLNSSMVDQRLKHPPAMQETRVQSLAQEDPLEKEMQPTPVFLPAESHGQRSLVGYSPGGWKELDTTERLHVHSHEDLQDLLELTPQNDVLFIICDWNAKEGSQETPGVTGKFGVGVQNELG